ncbi:PREDICTED: serologically defined colon cancer antigen 8 homolog isoform X2 [Papilio xuthus]|uniref:Serologically defined colon cancer antigen 8 homolog isoform X2 n=1 Tax=Papilio xuthus TaxID=66420 RepID=A0AAJ6ZT41_PAPXU|nr:PREDICTED: serologically defined colon cancer antigen 8 homolog isoform X2 [Papilio xuthus]
MSAYFSYRRPKMDYGSKRIPDYTELAYKEAVSKLRYFLSGSAPSVRSYGGSASIKNLDESDGDLDKKYSAYTGLNEYKPRPRLTAKYTTLYADSLNNYTPKVTTTPQPAPQAPAPDLSGGTNPDVVNFIQKQEEYIEQLERESQYCRDELNNLLGKVKEVISENEHLHEAQKNKIISRMFHYDSETDELEDVGDSTGLDSDNKATPSKSRRAKPRATKLEGPNIVFESRIAELEAQLTQAKIDLKKIQDENNENKRKLASGLVDSTCLDGFKRQIDNLQRDKSTLEAQIAKLKTNLEQKDSDGEGRYKRSDVVEHQLREERNNLEAEVRRLKDDLAKERSKIRELAGEGARRAIQERNSAEQRYNAHFDELQHDLAAQYDNVAKLQLELDRQRREESDLKREISMKNANIEELKMELKNKTATLQADLAQANAEKASLEEELANARLAIERQQRQAKHETNRLNSEIQSLRQRLDRADADLVHSRRENLRLSEQISTLEKELNMKSLTPISPEKNKKEKELSTMLESMENKHGRAQSRGRVDEPIRTQPDRSTSRETENRRKHRSGKESDSSNNQPIIVGPLTTNQDLSNYHGEKIYNLPLMIQQPFLREKKEPIKVDISVKLIPKPRKRDRKRRESHVDITSLSKPVKNNISMVVTNGDIQVLNETDEIPKITNNLNSPKINSDKNQDGEELDLSSNDLVESQVDKTLDGIVESAEVENTNDMELKVETGINENEQIDENKK